MSPGSKCFRTYLTRLRQTETARHDAVQDSIKQIDGNVTSILRSISGEGLLLPRPLSRDGRGLRRTYHFAARFAIEEWAEVTISPAILRKIERILDRQGELAGLFAIEVCGNSVLHNHLHLGLSYRPDIAGRYSRQRGRPVMA